MVGFGAAPCPLPRTPSPHQQHSAPSFSGVSQGPLPAAGCPSGHPPGAAGAQLSPAIPPHRAQLARYLSCPRPPPPATALRDRSPRLLCTP